MWINRSKLCHWFRSKLCHSFRSYCATKQRCNFYRNNLYKKNSKVMAAKKVDIMELRQLLLLKEKGESNRSCEKLLSIHRNTINHYVRMFRVSGLNYTRLLKHDDKELKRTVSFSRTAKYSKVQHSFQIFYIFWKRTEKARMYTRSPLREYMNKHNDRLWLQSVQRTL